VSNQATNAKKSGRDGHPRSWATNRIAEMVGRTESIPSSHSDQPTATAEVSAKFLREILPAFAKCSHALSDRPMQYFQCYQYHVRRSFGIWHYFRLSSVLQVRNNLRSVLRLPEDSLRLAAFCGQSCGQPKGTVGYRRVTKAAGTKATADALFAALLYACENIGLNKLIDPKLQAAVQHGVGKLTKQPGADQRGLDAGGDYAFAAAA
jgi:hypothetical protein